MTKNTQRFKIFDDIYGLIYFTDTERAIIDSPLFQRLRRLKQLGLAYLVFPGAVHTRFSHSIGTLAVAQKVIQVLKTNISKKDAEKLRLAALLHDIGHFPLSHTTERVYKKTIKKKADVEKIIKFGIEHKHSGTGHGRILNKQPRVKTSIKLHEEMGAKIITQTNFDGGITQILSKAEYEPMEIAHIITGSHENIILNQLMHSDIDIDQLDYLIRDSKNAGIMYGICDVDYIISCMTKIKRKKVVFFKLKGLKAIEHFFLSRYFYFTQILYHKTRSVIEEMAERIYKRAIDLNLKVEGKYIYKGSDLDELYRTHDIIGFDDTYFDRILKVVMNQKKNDKLRRYANALYRRKPPKLVYETLRMINKNKNEIRKDNLKEKTFLKNEKENEIRVVKEFDILYNYEQDKARENWLTDRELLYKHREAIRLQIPKSYDSKVNHIFLSRFKDTILKKHILNNIFKIYRIYKF